MDYDVVVVGAARPSRAGHRDPVKQLAPDASVVVLEKGSGAARTSFGRRDGPARDGRAVPGLEEAGRRAGPGGDRRRRAVPERNRRARTPAGWCRATCTTTRCYVVSLSNVVKWMAQRGRSASASKSSGFAGGRGAVRRAGMRRGRGDRQHGHHGRKASLARTSSSACGLRGRYTVFAEGARGHLGKQLLARYRADGKRSATPDLRDRHQGAVGSCPPTRPQPGRVVHTAGWPMAGDTSGGGFLYHWRTTRSRSVS